MAMSIAFTPSRILFSYARRFGLLAMAAEKRPPSSDLVDGGRFAGLDDSFLKNRIGFMKRLLLLAMCIGGVAAFPSLAKEKPEDHAYRILQVNAVSITVSFSKSGKNGSEHGTYEITNSAVVTIDGHPANARDLKGGMVTHLAISPDQKTVTKIEARDAPRSPEKGHAG
jgi:hypothetical protein